MWMKLRVVKTLRLAIMTRALPIQMVHVITVRAAS